MSIIKKLTQNFNFIENDEIKMQNKNEIINLLFQIENHNNDYESSLSKMRKILENIIFNIFCDQNKTNELQEKLSEDIKYIKNYWINDQKIINSMYTIKELGNEAVHFNSNKIINKLDMNDYLNSIKALYIILINYYDTEIKKIKGYNKYELNTELYFNSSKIEPIQEKVEFQKEVPEFKVNTNSVFTWLSLKNSKIIVPIYQRRYEWKEENINVLINDIKSRMIDNSDHYFGVIARRTEINSKGENIIKIIDGQQRITTSLIICVAIKDFYLMKFNESIDKLPLMGNIFNNAKIEDYFLNPGGTSENNISFRNVLNGIKNEGNYAKTNFNKNYLFILNWLKKNINTEDEIIKFTRTFLLNFKFADIGFNGEQYNSKNEMELFENLNSKGMSLEISDLIKTYIFMLNKDSFYEKNNQVIVGTYNNNLSSTKMDDANLLEDFYINISELFEGCDVSQTKSERFRRFKNAINIIFDNHSEIENIEIFKEKMNKMKNLLSIFSEIKRKTTNYYFQKFLDVIDIIEIIKDRKKRNLIAYFEYIIYFVIEKQYEKKLDLVYKIEFELKENEKKELRKLFLEIIKLIIKNKIIQQSSDSKSRHAFIWITNQLYIKFLNNEINNINQFCIEANILIKKIIENKSEIFGFQSFVSAVNGSFSTIDKVIELLKLTEAIMTNPDLVNNKCKIEKTTLKIDCIIPENNLKWLEKIDEKNKKKWQNEVAILNKKIGNFVLMRHSLSENDKQETFINKKRYYNDLINNSKLYRNDNELIDLSKKTALNLDDIEKRTSELIKYITENVITY